jgi:superfamily II DNA or RNA helicase
MNSFSIGSIVRCRNREWVILPSQYENLLLLRPLTGSDKEICGIYKPLSNLGFDRIEPATFPLPTAQDSSDAVGTELLWNAARLSLRDGAGPFRSLGRISVRPRPYQFVPLLMALRLQPIRLLIADDVGIGKTIEALLIARELMDRGEIQRLCVLCPPYLCDQWKKELSEKFHIEAVIIRSGTINQLERNLPSGEYSIFNYYPYIVVSIDYAKSESHRANFLHNCPEFVILDEAHGAARPYGHARLQQQRHELLREIVKDNNRHLILLTATPHSGIEESFLSLLGLLQPDFLSLNLQRLSESQREYLARHFIQRRRADILNCLGEETPFPKRDSIEETYELSKSYRQLFEQVYRFSRELVQTGETLTGWRRRIRFWTALALLRCVMSSPAAAILALQKRGKRFLPEEELLEESYSSYIYEPSEEETVDLQPNQIIDESKAELSESEQKRLREFSRLAEQIKVSDQDTKIKRCTEIIHSLLLEGYKPIVWCRYIATSDYVAEQLQRRLKNGFKDLRVVSVTGKDSEEERRLRVEELTKHPKRVLVATDCLSEGINLQEHFTAVVHYDLPWNPNRLEQREGRVDRFGQFSKKVKTVLFYGLDNPVDGAVLDVLLRKAKEIHRDLGITVPVPMDSETIMEAVLKALFSRAPEMKQLNLFEEPIVRDVHRRWEEVASRERESRTRFAQRAIKPDEVDREVDRELKESDTVLGDSNAVRDFVINTCQRLGVTVQANSNGTFSIYSLDRFPDMVKSILPNEKEWKVSFVSPSPENVTYLGRNHPFVSSLAQFLLEEALTRRGEAHASRCGVIWTNSVDRRTSLFLLRIRFSIEEPEKKSLLAEEVLVCGFRGFPPDRIEWLSDNESLNMLQRAKPEANITSEERNEVLNEVLAWWEDLQPGIEQLVQRHAQKLEDSHRRVRLAVHLPRRGLSIKPHLPPDLLGVLVLLPVPKGISR